MAALRTFLRTVSRRLQGTNDGVRINSVVPGRMMTGRRQSFLRGWHQRIRAPRRTSQLKPVTVGHTAQLRQMEIEICFHVANRFLKSRKNLARQPATKEGATEFGISVASTQVDMRYVISA